MGTDARTVVGLVGKKRSGKDTLADALVERYGAVKFGFADAIRERLAVFLGIPVSKIVEFQEPYYRKPLQDLGNYWRSLEPDTWIDELIARVNISSHVHNTTRVVIKDVRMLREAALLRTELGAKLFRIIRTGQDVSDADVTETEQDSIVVEENLESYSVEMTQGEIATEVAVMMGWGE